MAEKREGPRDHRLVAALAAGQTIVAAAREAGFNERSVRRKLTDPAFRKRVDAAKAEAVGQAVALLGRLMTTAALKLGQLLESADERVRLMAAERVIGLALKGRTSETLEAEFAALVERLDKVVPRGWQWVSHEPT
jgi:hypothetical protein